jgi:hypothetical protein
MEMVRHRPSPLLPRYFDDHPVRVYRWLLAELTAAGPTAGRLVEIQQDYPDVVSAHLLHYSPDVASRQVLEAHLLTGESFEKIATRFFTTAKAIEYFADIFFDVRDRLANPTWIVKTIRDAYGSPQNRSSREEHIQQRGYALKLFGYFGGPLVLDAVVGVIHEGPAKGSEDLRRWFQAAIDQSIQVRAAVAASTIHLDRRNTLSFLKLAFNHRRVTNASKEQEKREEQHLDKILAWVARNLETPKPSKKSAG